MKLALEGMYVTFREDARIKTTTGCIIDNSIGINLDTLFNEFSIRSMREMKFIMEKRVEK